MCASEDTVHCMDYPFRCPNRRHCTFMSLTPPYLVSPFFDTTKISAIRTVRTCIHELFRWTHVVLTIGSLLVAYYHQRQTVLPIAILMIILLLQWLLRLIKMSLPIPNATSQILPGNVVRLTIPIPVNFVSRWLWKNWTPGTHVRITVPSIGLLQPHPFTIATLASEKNIQLYIRANAGFTQRLYEKTAGSVISGKAVSLKVHFEGMYHGNFPNFAKFEVVLLISSGIGVAFTIAILKDIIEKVKIIQQSDGNCRCKRIGFVWIVKHRGLSLRYWADRS